jgi:hypothetical protein
MPLGDGTAILRNTAARPIGSEPPTGIDAVSDRECQPPSAFALPISADCGNR